MTSYELFKDLHSRYPEMTKGCRWEAPEGWGVILSVLLASLYEPLRRARENLKTMETAMLEGRSPEFYTQERLKGITFQLEEALRNTPQILQVKEKFGGLRVYIDGGTPEMHAQISLAERLAAKTCQECGSTVGVTLAGRGWVRTVCATCKEKFPPPAGVGDVAIAPEPEPPTSGSGT